MKHIHEVHTYFLIYVYIICILLYIYIVYISVLVVHQSSVTKLNWFKSLFSFNTTRTCHRRASSGGGAVYSGIGEGGGAVYSGIGEGGGVGKSVEGATCLLLVLTLTLTHGPDPNPDPRS